MTTIKDYIEVNRDRFLEELFELIRIPSVSAKEENKQDMFRAVNFLKDSLLKAGATKAEVFSTGGHPVLYGEKVISQDLPTILVYGHMMYSRQNHLNYGIRNPLNR